MNCVLVVPVFFIGVVQFDLKRAFLQHYTHETGSEGIGKGAML